MPAFNLPDLGEGLQDAEIVKWHIQEGQNVEVDQLVIEVETAKAIVELPSPVKSKVTKLCVGEGETIVVGQALFEFECANKSDKKLRGNNKKARESVSVVGVLPSSEEESHENLYEGFSYETVAEPNQPPQTTKKRRKQDVIVAPPSIMAFAKKLGLQDQLLDYDYGSMSQKDLIGLYQQSQNVGVPSNNHVHNNQVIKLTGARKVMAQSMTKSHQHIPAVTLFDDADISHWTKKDDITLRTIQALIDATQKVPLLNAWFDEETLSVQLFEDVNLGVAVNAKEGLFVPVIRKIQSMPQGEIRAVMNSLIDGVNGRTIKAQKLLGATISLSNFGTLSGRYATPIIVPPQVAIIGIGKIREEAVVRGGKIVVGRIMPISLSFDHRAASGADASAFMRAMIRSLDSMDS